MTDNYQGTEKTEVNHFYLSQLNRQYCLLGHLEERLPEIIDRPALRKLDIEINYLLNDAIKERKRIEKFAVPNNSPLSLAECAELIAFIESSFYQLQITWNLANGLTGAYLQFLAYLNDFQRLHSSAKILANLAADTLNRQDHPVIYPLKRKLSPDFVISFKFLISNLKMYIQEVQTLSNYR